MALVTVNALSNVIAAEIRFGGAFRCAITSFVRDHAAPGASDVVTAAQAATKPLRAMGGFFAMSLDTFVMMFKPPFAWREYVLQSWFVARVSVLPALMLTMPYSVLLVFTFNILLKEFGASDFSGTGAAIGTVNQIGPIVTVLVVSGAGATAMCADLGARTIRDELDALRVMGINPVQALVVPRVLAATTVALALSATVIIVGLAGAFFFCVFVQNVSAGAFITGMTLLTGAGDVVVSLIEGNTVRAFRGTDRLLQGHLGPRWSRRGGQCGQRDGRVHLHGPVRHQRRRDRRRHPVHDLMSQTIPARAHPRLTRSRDGFVSEWNRIGAQAQFYAKTLAAIPDAVINYRTELWRLIAQMGLGTGALAVVGGTVAIVGFLTMTTGRSLPCRAITSLPQWVSKR